MYALTPRGNPFGLDAYKDSITFAYVIPVKGAISGVDHISRLDFMPIVLSNPTFFRENNYREPRNHDGLNTPLASYFDKPNYSFFDYLREHPTVQNTFMSAMKAQVRSSRLTSSVYPYSKKLSTATMDDTAVAIVDVGGSRAELLQELRKDHPGIQGRMIVQDRQETLSALGAPPQGIELMVHDMFTEQPVKGSVKQSYSEAETRLYSH